MSVFRKKGGPDKKVGSDKTNSKGKWSLEENAGPGKYYAKTPSSAVAAGTCKSAVSKTPSW